MDVRVYMISTISPFCDFPRLRFSRSEDLIDFCLHRISVVVSLNVSGPLVRMKLRTSDPDISYIVEKALPKVCLLKQHGRHALAGLCRF